jgi:nucleotidyltransferase/DNA polymerase involved in DNA repair
MRVAATIVHEIRSSIMKELQITCSAGIAKNKLLARIASNLNKPNQQTIILRRGVETLLSHLPIEKLPKIGNKIGKEKLEEIKRLELVNCIDLQKYSLQEMKTMFGETGGRWLYDACRGDDFEEVLKKGPTKKIMRSMTLTPLSNNDVELRQDFSYLAKEICDCLAKDKKEHKRKPKTFHLHYRCVNEKEKTVSTPMTKITQHASSKGFNPDLGQYSFEAILFTTMNLFHESMGDRSWTMRWIGIAAGNFVQDPKPVSPKATITSYFRKIPNTTDEDKEDRSESLSQKVGTVGSEHSPSLKRKLEEDDNEKDRDEGNKKQKIAFGQ